MTGAFLPACAYLSAGAGTPDHWRSLLLQSHSQSLLVAVLRAYQVHWACIGYPVLSGYQVCETSCRVGDPKLDGLNVM